MPSVRVHYHRNDGNYTEVQIWTWDWEGNRNPAQQDLAPAAEDDFGVVFEIPTDKYGLNPDQLTIGILPRIERNWEKKDDPERKWTPDCGCEVWIIQDDERIYTKRPDTTPTVKAFLDKGNVVVARFTGHVSRAGDLSKTVVRGPGGKTIATREVHHVHDYGATFVFVEAIPFLCQRWDIEVPNFRPAGLRPRNVLFDGTEFGTLKPLGALCTPAETVFRVFAPCADAVAVVIYKTALGKEEPREVPLKHLGKGVWEATEKGDLDGLYYLLRVKNSFADEPVEAADPYSVNTTGRDRRSRITDLRRTDPPGFRPVKRPPFSGRLADLIATELHVRDFSVSHNSGMRAKGNYLAFTEKDTHLPHHPEVSTGLAHLRELGVTHVQLLPIQDFDNFEDRHDYNWGYMTTCFWSPEGWYASALEDASRIIECKRMIQALHEAGIRVVMDVVYNHTAPNASFNAVAPGYYYRLRADGSRWNGSGCGNEFKSEAPMGRRFIIDSLKYWVEEFGVDGFRFDLMGLIDRETMMQARRELLELDPTLLIYGEPWVAAGCGLDAVTDKWAVRGTGVGAFNDHYRNALKGEPDNHHWGYVQGAPHRDAVAGGIAGSIDDWALHPGDSINYGDCHDNLCLWDKIAACCPHETEPDRIRMYNLAMAILAVSQGAMFLHGGHETTRTKFGNHNSYNAPDEINRIDWSRKARYANTFTYTRDMIRLRRAHPLFRLPTGAEVRKRIDFLFLLPKSPQAISFSLDGDGLEGESWSAALVLINPYHRARTFPLPKGVWNVHACGHTASVEALQAVEGRFAVAGRTLAVLAQAKDSSAAEPAGAAF
ncbi:MAG: type I pullulanase [Candidatus Sumerlaeia bacterium]|nr:type I pullulanase [Candidatus Sumerlaeia bacterium]